MEKGRKLGETVRIVQSLNQLSSATKLSAKNHLSAFSLVITMTCIGKLFFTYIYICIQFS